jgi:ABC-type transporter Mla MlaB component
MRRPTSLVLEGPLDDDAVNAFRLRLASMDMQRDEVVIHCDGITSLDPGSVARLWFVLNAWREVTDQDVRLVGVPRRLARQLRAHPLARLIVHDDHLFSDPFDAGMVSSR